jgi:small subunit ribosomal protein S20
LTEATIGGFELANTESAKKRIRQTEKRTERNRHYKASARTYVKRVRRLIAENKLDEAEVAARDAYSTLDKAARKHIVHPSNAARRKGRLMAALAAARSAEQADKPAKK